jgi:hypothetical protein
MAQQESTDAVTPFGRYTKYSPEFIKEYFDFLKTWSPTLADNNISPTDWRILLPSAFYLNWSDPQTFQKAMTDFTIWLPVALNPDKKKRDNYTRQIVQVIKEDTSLQVIMPEET